MNAIENGISTKYASLFIDFENIYYSFTELLKPTDDALRAISELIGAIKSISINKFSEYLILQNAYADFDNIEQLVQGDLYLLGIQTRNVLGTEHKNAADMALCIDAMETLYTRREITSFYIAAGDRDYIPLVQHLQRQAKTVRIVGIRKNLSGDLLKVAGEESFLDAIDLIGPFMEQFRSQTNHRCAASGSAASRPGTPASAGNTGYTKAPSGQWAPQSTERPVDDMEEYEQEAIRLMLENFKGKREIWMTPYLHKLRAAMPELAEYDRKELLSRLSKSGAIRVEKREGDPYPYSVIVVDWNNPRVRKANP